MYESKGLEFNDVIIYNFFDHSDAAGSQWKVLQDLVLETQKVPIIDETIMNLDELEIQEGESLDKFKKRIKEIEQGKAEATTFEERITVSLNKESRFAQRKAHGDTYRKFSSLCIELKFLYVAITRAKNRVIIYDDLLERRKPMQEYWTKMGCVNVVTKQML